MQTTTTTNIHPESTLSQRRGKIARLPRAVRDQLNTRLDDGQEADDILPWLNALPEVQEIIATRFNGVPISPQNLSAWRQGGFQEWLLHHELLDSAAHVGEHLKEMGDALECDDYDDVPLVIADQMIAQLSIRFNTFLASWSGGPLDTHLALMLKFGQFILKLQQSAYRARHQAIELLRSERQVERECMDEIRADALRDYMKQRAAARKAEKAQQEGQSKKPAPRNGSTQPVAQPSTQPAAAAGQSSSFKANQASREPSSNQTSSPTIVPLPIVGRVAPGAVHLSSVPTP